MSKAEERSKEIMQAALDYANNLDDIKPTDEFSRNLCIALGQAFIKGAEWADNHQAEKDNELTWNDVALILNTAEEFNRKNTVPISDKEYFKEVLKRFNKERRITMIENNF